MTASGKSLLTRRELVVRGALGAAAAAIAPTAAILGPSGAHTAVAKAKQPLIGVNVGYPLRAGDVVNDIKAFEQVIGRPVDFISDFGAVQSWREMAASSGHALRVWREVAIGSRRKLLWTQPLAVADTPLSEVAAGKHDSTFEIVATHVRNNGFYDAIINLGPDMNGGWNPWAATRETKDAYIEAWRRVAAIFRRVSPSYRLCWSPTRHAVALPPHEAWPGAEHVDFIGSSLLVSSPPLGAETAEFFDATIIGHGREAIAGRQPFALAWLAEFARTNKKRIVLTDVGVGVDVPAGVPPEAAPILDDATIVTKLAEWIVQNDVALHCWRDIGGSGGMPLHSRISRASSITGVKPKEPTDERPRMAAAFRKAWGSSS